MLRFLALALLPTLVLVAASDFALIASIWPYRSTDQSLPQPQSRFGTILHGHFWGSEVKERGCEVEKCGSVDSREGGHGTIGTPN